MGVFHSMYYGNLPAVCTDIPGQDHDLLGLCAQAVSPSTASDIAQPCSSIRSYETKFGQHCQQNPPKQTNNLTQAKRLSGAWTWEPCHCVLVTECGKSDYRAPKQSTSNPVGHSSKQFSQQNLIRLVCQQKITSTFFTIVCCKSAKLCALCRKKAMGSKSHEELEKDR